MTQSLNLHPNVEILGNESKNFKVIPSNTIYYNTYTYKIVFDATPYKEDGNRLDLDAYFKLSDELYKFTLENLESKCSFRSAKNKVLEIFCYIRSFEDYKKLLENFSKFINYVSGPINEEHYKLLQSREYYVEPRESYWYKKYDAKIYVFMPYRTSVNLKKDEKGSLHAELLSALKENIPQDAIKLNTWPNSFHSLEFYTKIDEFNQYYPFLKMMHNQWTFRITKCILYQK